MKKCPFCAEEIQDEAKKCKHCGEWLKDSEPQKPVAEETVEKPTNIVSSPTPAPFISRLKEKSYVWIIPLSIIGAILGRALSKTYREYSYNPPVATFFSIVMILSILCYLWGCSIWAKKKNYSRWLGLIGIAPLVGLLFLLVMPVKPEGTDKSLFQLVEHKGIRIVLYIFAVLIMLTVLSQVTNILRMVNTAQRPPIESFFKTKPTKELFGFVPTKSSFSVYDERYKVIYESAYVASYNTGAKERAKGNPYAAEVILAEPVVQRLMKQQRIQTNYYPGFDKAFRSGFFDGYRAGYYGHPRKKTRFD